MANVGVFADQTIATITNPDLGLPVGKSVYVREYIVQSEPEEQDFSKLEKELEHRLLRLVQYSVALVDIAETSKSEAEKVEKYANFLKTLQKQAEERAELEPGYYDDVIEKISQQEKFHEALQAAQPILNATGRGYQKLLDNLEKSLKVLEAKLDRKIDERFEIVIKYQRALEEEKYAVLIALGRLYQTYKGEPEGFQQLRDGGVIRKKNLLPKGDPTEEDLSNIAEHLIKRLEITHKIWQEIEPDWELYRATHRELDELYALIKTGINRTRATVIIWARAHQKMASGKTNPAEWFDVDDAPAQLFRLGTKAVF
ncbi:MAG: hypothetical protein AMJ55_12225 [Gammaproteobacteria bacterium SG8_15]|nr:MAG: hypothetical protein AMJ55_12225 [Gammaproteobacteria bacterium SG8_15]